MEGSHARLKRVGPGLGSRSRIWSVVHNRIKKSPVYSQLAKSDITALNRLTSKTSWMDQISPSWKETYSAVYETALLTPLPPSTEAQIDRDVPRTYSLFTENSRQLRLRFPPMERANAYHDALRAVLHATAVESGYAQGMNFLAASFLISESCPRSAFILCSYLLKNCAVEVLFDAQCSSLMDYAIFFEDCLQRHNPRLHAHLQRCEFTPLLYVVEWFTTCFVGTNPGEISACVLDLLFGGVKNVLLRVGLALLEHLQGTLMGFNQEQLQVMTSSSRAYDSLEMETDQDVDTSVAYAPKSDSSSLLSSTEPTDPHIDGDVLNNSGSMNSPYEQPMNQSPMGPMCP
eukprot:CAMPEP_0173325656 /NCGR_PEP_ID=MMETSP1144-20121109/638_1 /TAXON_ID=483371 /ORGANISM="non described non described, Strain CCMP2298" /LENGTH=344 /DNA_ID=CAMNT_0014269893 /DNA_START=108 /DNA_END=1142 /DNA_ORIENTATION=-